MAVDMEEEVNRMTVPAKYRIVCLDCDKQVSTAMRRREALSIARMHTSILCSMVMVWKPESRRRTRLWWPDGYRLAEWEFIDELQGIRARHNA